MITMPALLLRKKRIVKKLQESGAFSETTAKTLQEAGVFNPDAFPKITEELVKEKVLVKTKDNKYYLEK